MHSHMCPCLREGFEYCQALSCERAVKIASQRTDCAGKNERVLLYSRDITERFLYKRRMSKRIKLY